MFALPGLHFRHAGLGLLLFVLAMRPCVVDAQVTGAVAPELNFLSQSWTEKDGLPGSGLWVVTQDLLGYLWLGTNAGLVRFDGVRFVHWNAIEPALPSSVVASMLPARDGSLWIGFGGTGGVGVIRRGKFEYTSVVSGRPVGTIASFHEGAGGVLWTGGAAGALRLIDGKWERLTGLLSAPIYQFFEDRSGRLLAATSAGVITVMPDGSSALVKAMPSGARGIAEDSQGNLWITTNAGALASLTSGGPHRADVDAMTGVALLRARRGNLWVGTSGSGLWVAPPGAAPLATLRRMDRDTVSHPVIRALWEDRESNVWVGTQHGLTRLTPARLAWSPPGLDRDDQPVRAVSAGSEDALWVSAGDAFYRMVAGRSAPAALRRGPDAITAIHADRNSRLWIGSGRGELSYLDGERVIPVIGAGQAGTIASITSDGANELLVSDLEQGIYRLRGKTLELLDLRPGVDREPALVLYCDRRARVWIGFSDGTIASYSGGRLQTYDLPGHEPGIAPGRAYSFYEDSSGRIWVGTNAGLLALDGDRFVPIALDYQQTGNYVIGVVEDIDGHLWLACSQGIVRIARDQLARAVADRTHVASHTLYDLSDGMPGRPAWLSGSPTVARTTRGTLWFVTSNGLAAVDPTQWQRSRTMPPVIIESVLADGRAVTPFTGGVQLQPRTGRVQVDFTALSFAAPHKVQFRYRLEDFDTGWIDAGGRRQAFYTNLPPGNYRFQVVAGYDGAWGDVAAMWAFSVQPAYYQTTWFLVAVASAVVMLVFGAFQYRARRARDRFRMIIAERVRVSREIHDTLLQDLIGVTLQFDALEGELGAGTTARIKFQSLRRQLRQSIRAARQSIRDLRTPMPKLDMAAGLRKIIKETMPAQSNVTAHVEVIGSARPLPSKQEEELLRIAQEAVINAVRHAQATRVKVELRYEPAAVHLNIIDNGRGFDPQVAEFNAHDHWGLASMQERAEQSSAEFRLSTKPGEGTVIQVTVAAPMIAEEVPS